MMVQVLLFENDETVSIPAEKLVECDEMDEPPLEEEEDLEPPFEIGAMVQLLNQDSFDGEDDDNAGEVVGFDPKQNLVQVTLFDSDETINVSPGQIALFENLS